MKAGKVELEFKVKGGRITRAEVLEDGSCKLLVDVARRRDEFVLIKASTLSLQDDFMDYKPQNRREAEVKNVLTEAIKSGVDDFYRPKYDPSFDEDGDIQFVAGKKPAFGLSFAEWLTVAEELYPNSRLGTKWEYYAFLGVLLKRMVKHGMDKKKAWHAVCGNSEKIGHYKSATTAAPKWAYTGSHPFYGFDDLANTSKLVSVGSYEYAEASGSYLSLPYDAPLASFRVKKSDFEKKRYDAVGWVVLELVG